MKQMLLILLVFTTVTASAQVYRRIGPDGQVYFSDRPGPDAEQVNITPAPAVRLPPVSGQADSAGQPESGDTEPEGDTAPLYTEFTIVSPTGGQGIRANAISPGAMETPGLVSWLQTLPGGVKGYNDAQPQGRLGHAEEIADAAVYLGSDRASFVNGSTLAVDGAVHAALWHPL